METGRKWQSEETGYLHYCYRSDSLDTIPTSENFSFVLALLRSRMSDNIQEAKGILHKLLSYQVGGNFPIYLHEYPVLYDRWRAAEVLPALIWIVKGFHHVLGEELKGKLDKALRLAIDHSLTVLREHPAGYLQTLRIGCCAKALGKYFEEKELITAGEEIMMQVEHLGVQPSWFVSDQLGHLLVSLNLDVIWPVLWQHCQGVYHQHLSLYCGPHIQERCDHQLPAPTLLDLYLKEDMKVPELNPIFVHGSLVHPFEKPSVEHVVYKGSLAGKNWEIMKTGDFVCSLIDQDEDVDKKGFSPVYMVWDNQNVPHSLVAQGGNVIAASFQRNENTIEFLMTLGEEAEYDHPKDRVEVAFFCSRAQTEVSIDEKRATVFRLGEKVRIRGSKDTILEFDLREGEGDFTGHLSVGNRPSQKASKGEAYDWKIALRSVRRTSFCVIKVKLLVNA